MVELGLPVGDNCQLLQWYCDTVPMKESSGMIWQTYLISCEMREVAMQTSEPVYTRYYTESLVKILDSTYAKIEL